MSAPLLDVGFIVSRRLELGYSLRDMQGELGSSLGVIKGIEDARSHAKVTLPVLLQVADTLQVPASRLLMPEHREAVEPSGEAEELSDDARQVGALLLAAGKAIPRAALAGALGWNLAQVHRAVRELGKHVETSGSLLRLTTTGGRVGLLARTSATTQTQTKKLHHAVMAVDELKRGEARVLSAVAHGEVTTDHEQNVRRGDRPVLQSLIKRGLITRGEQGALSLHGDVAFSLGLTDAKSAGLRRGSVDASAA